MQLRAYALGAGTRALVLALLLVSAAGPGCGRVSYGAPDAFALEDARSSEDAAVDARGDDAATALDAAADALAVDAAATHEVLAVEGLASATCAPTDFVVRGAGLEAGVQVFVVDAAGTRFDADVSITSAAELAARAVLAGAALGACQVHVRWLDGTDRSVTSTLTSSPYAGAHYVDRDVAATGDGSRASPWSTIAEGVAAASDGAAVLVDGSPDAYDPFTLGSGVSVVGCPWSTAARPIVQWSERHALALSADGASVQGLDFVVSIHASTMGIEVSGGSRFAFLDCGVSAEVSGADVSVLAIDGTAGVEIADAWLHDIHHTGTTGTRQLAALRATNVQGIEIHHSELSGIGFSATGGGGVADLTAIVVQGNPQDVRLHHLLVHDLFVRSDGENHLGGILLSSVNNPTFTGVFELYALTIDDLRHADAASSVVTAGHVSGLYCGSCGGVRTWRDNIAAHFMGTDEPMTPGVSSYYGFWVDGIVTPAPSPQPMATSLVFDVGVPLPSGANASGWASGFVNQVSAGPGSIQNADAVDPLFDLGSGARYYHPTAAAIATGASDGGEMGAFGSGPSWTPPSQRSR
ncbi:MAG: hypothetical protein K1X94_20485 [Sandaracinaceae bacterium]|nr:hypothetical protein [Sandaracinaceae bacterium]